MGPDLEKSINELSLRMRLLRAIQEEELYQEVTERESLILQQLYEQGPLSISDIAGAWPNISESTISLTITKLWKEKKMVSKAINPENQRVTIVELTEKGREVLKKILKQSSDRINALFKAINLTPEEKDLLSRICQKGVEFFDKHLGIRRQSQQTKYKV
jgi:DNA-binding MarR family transcriptional regulator